MRPNTTPNDDELITMTRSTFASALDRAVDHAVRELEEHARRLGAQVAALALAEARSADAAQALARMRAEDAGDEFSHFCAADPTIVN